MIDLFAGCGGLTEGFKETGKYETIASVEWDKDAVSTLKNRLKTKWKYKNIEKIVLYNICHTEEK